MRSLLVTPSCWILLLHPVTRMLDSSPGQTGWRMGEDGRRVKRGIIEPRVHSCLSELRRQTDGRTDVHTVEICDPPEIVIPGFGDPRLDLFC